MQALESSLRDRSPDRNVRFAAILIGASGLLSLLVELIEKLGLLPLEDRVLATASILSEAIIVASIAWAGPLALREMEKRRQNGVTAHRARGQVETLFGMAEMLQSATGYGDANAVLRSAASRLLPDFGGALYIFNNSGDRMELSTSWSWFDEAPAAEAIMPTHCWALKRGKTHINRLAIGSLHCQHHNSESAALEIPMMARGEVYGLLLIGAAGDDGEQRLTEAMPLANALADAMSLALSNIALREKLRTLALRDALTGLYNRRYMEDALDRYANLAERNEGSLSVVMFDLDHFKRLNDENGHATGDLVLTSVAAAMLGTVRPCDVACRFGGEEFIILYPNCSLLDAVARAEELRLRIERLSDNHGIPISASFGVAAIPETSAKGADVLTDADAALYRAKAEGRNRVVSALHRPIRSIPKTSAAA